MTTIYHTQIVGAGDIPAIAALLQENNLPTEDLGKDCQLFWMIRDQERVLSVIGIETLGPYGLLRSMATQKDMRNQGLAGQLVDELMTYAKANQYKDVYLLTTTAEKFFLHKGFEKIERDNTPNEIKASTEFSHLCPSTAIVMKKAPL